MSTGLKKTKTTRKEAGNCPIFKIRKFAKQQKLFKYFAENNYLPFSKKQ